MLRISGLCRTFLRCQRFHVTFVFRSTLCSFGTKRSFPRSNAAGARNHSSAARITDALNPISSPPYSYMVHCFGTVTFFCLLLLNFLVWGILSSSTLQRCIKHEPLFEWKDSGHLLKAFVFVCVYVCYLRATYGVTAADMHWARAAGQLMSTVNICGLGLNVILHFGSCDVWSANLESRMFYPGGCSGLPYVRGGVNEDVEGIIYK